jgi:hypothetical protein
MTSTTVHTNNNGQLTILSEFIKKEFGIVLHHNFRGGCLIAQVIFIVNALTGIKLESLAATARNRWWRVPYLGLTLDEIFDTIGRKYGIQLYAKRHTNINSALKAMKDGKCVLAMTCGEDGILFGSGWQHIGNQYIKTGVLSRSDVLMSNGWKKASVYHSYLLVGYDEGEGSIIFRDTRNKYSFNGYGKIIHKDLTSRPDLLAYVEVGVV